MPRRDGTGPMGMGAMTGRGFGYCNSYKTPSFIGRMGLGVGTGRGFCRFPYNYNLSPEEKKEMLIRQKDVLENQLETIKKQLED